MFGDPVPTVTPPFGMTRKVEGIAERGCRVAAGGDRRKVQN
jgi:hypothetical protein